jgi:hypothetical protein
VAKWNDKYRRRRWMRMMASGAEGGGAVRPKQKQTLTTDQVVKGIRLIQSNISIVEKYVSMIGGKDDSADLRTQITVCEASLRQQIRTAEATLSTLERTFQPEHMNDSGSGNSSPAGSACFFKREAGLTKEVLVKLQRDFGNLKKGFERVQTGVEARSRTHPELPGGGAGGGGGGWGMDPGAGADGDGSGGGGSDGGGGGGCGGGGAGNPFSKGGGKPGAAAFGSVGPGGGAVRFGGSAGTGGCGGRGCGGGGGGNPFANGSGGSGSALSGGGGGARPPEEGTYVPRQSKEDQIMAQMQVA